MLCPNCGKETAGKFCPYCGTAMHTENPAVPSGASTPRKQNAPAAPQAPAQTPAPAVSPAPGQTPPQSYAPAAGRTPTQSYAPAPGYTPQQGYNPAPQAQGSYMPQSPLGNTPARQLIRRLATSPAYVIAVLAFTIQFVLFVIRGVDMIPVYLDSLKYYRGVSTIETRIITNLISFSLSGLVSLIMLIALWVNFGSAANKRNAQMCTGGLTTFKVFSVLSVILFALLIVVLVILTVVLLISGQNGDLFPEISRIFRDMLAQFPVDVELPAGNLLFTAVIIFMIVILTIVVLALIYYVLTIKSLNTAKRVITGGYPDDRVSAFVGVCTILSALLIGASGVSALLEGSTLNLFNGANSLLSAVSGICFAVVLFKFRSGMRQLGVYKGVRQR